jgi:hypothetical protein
VRPALANVNYPCLNSESISNEEKCERRDCDIVMRYATPSACAFVQRFRRGSRQLLFLATGSRSETPFRPFAEALDPYRAENRCALKSLDTDRSTTLSPETVTASVYLQQRIEMSQRVIR